VDHDEIQVNGHDDQSGYALFEAEAKGHEKVVDCLLSRQDLMPNFTSFFWDTTTLIEAIQKGHEDIVPFPAELSGNRSKRQKLDTTLRSLCRIQERLQPNG
jgi:hypothetical protein